MGHREKQEKWEKREKGEKRGDRSGAYIGGVILVWIGLVLYLQQSRQLVGRDTGGLIVLGIGGILLAAGALRLGMTGRARGYGGLIAGAVLTVIGLTIVFGVSEVWPLVLVAIGVLIIVSAAMARRRTPRPNPI